jgi:hypothetical protein
MTYTIIGGDKKEYGPITDTDMHQWIAEGRLNAQSLAKNETDTAWRTLGSFPEFNDVLATAAPSSSRPGAPSTFVTPVVDFLTRDYELDIGGCVSKGWTAYKNNFGPLFGAFLIGILIIVIASTPLNMIVNSMVPKHTPDLMVYSLTMSFLLACLMALVFGPVMGGLYHVFIQAGRNLPVNVGDLFIGFKRNYKNLFLGQLILSLISSLCMIPYNVVTYAKVLPLVDQMQHATPADVQNLVPQLFSALGASLPVLLVCMIPLTYLTVSFQFTLPLIVDKQLNFGAALKSSWKMVHRHWLQVFGLTIVVGLVSIVGLFGCIIGVIVTIPIGIATMMAAYETIFGIRKN